MFKIKLLILLLISYFLSSCSSSNINNNQETYSLSYIGGGYDGLVLKKILGANLRNFNFYDNKSLKRVKANIDHDTELFITNIDNTSDRERVATQINIEIYDEELDCNIFKFKETMSQFYIYASNEKFLSNDKALEEIKYRNTEEIVKKFINSLNKVGNSCVK
tara:strand:+ start:442 stop:930 length:489 start_codon:yes stop_codon:yes gene_type:complete